MLSRDICLECLFRHTNGMGLCFERFLKTALYHVVPFGRFTDKTPYKPVNQFEKGMDLRFRRIWWADMDKSFKQVCFETKYGLKQETIYVPPGVSSSELPSKHREGFFLEPNMGILRHLNTVTNINVMLQCSCDSGRIFSRQVNIGLLRKHKRNDIFSIALAKWDNEGRSYEDPLWEWSLMGSGDPSPAVGKNTASPIVSTCPKCKSMINLKNISIPETTWLFMAEIAEPLWKTSLQGFAQVSSYVLGGVTFRLGFILLYNTTTGQFTSMNIRKGWRFFEDACENVYRACNPNRVKYRERINLRAFYFRQAEKEPHRCLQEASLQC